MIYLLHFPVRLIMKKFLLAFLMLSLGSPVFAQDASTAWRKVIKKCAKSDLIGSQSLFFGVSNTIGPGSVWRFANDKSIRLMFELSDAFPDQTAQSKMIKANNTGDCLDTSSSSWNIKLGLPFSTGATPLSLDIGALLGQAKKVTVSISGFALDDLKETNWKEAFKGLTPDNAYAKELLQENRLVAENVVKVTGFKAVFDYKTALSADVQAKYKGSAFTLGNSSTGNASQAGGTTGNTAGSASNAASSPSSSNSNASSGASSGNNAGTSSCSASSGTASNGTSASTGTGTANSTTSGSPGTGSATLHVDFTSNNQITICADGPFYLIAAYSKLVNGAPIGIAPTAESLTLVPATIPTGAVPASDRQPKP
jgi:hypothetical protein